MDVTVLFYALWASSVCRLRSCDLRCMRFQLAPVEAPPLNFDLEFLACAQAAALLPPAVERLRRADWLVRSSDLSAAGLKSNCEPGRLMVTFNVLVLSPLTIVMALYRQESAICREKKSNLPCSCSDLPF